MRKKVISIVIIVIAALAALYVALGLYFTSHFYFNSTVNGLNASGKSAKAVYKEITDSAKAYTISFVRSDGTVEATVSSDDIGFSVDYDVEDVAEILKAQNGFQWIQNIAKHNEYETAKGNSYNSSSLDSVVGALNLKDGANATECEDAYLTYSSKDQQFIIEKEVYGTKFDNNETKKTLIDAIENFVSEINIDDGSCYKKPDIISTDKKLNKVLKTVNGYMNTITTYDLGETIETVDMDTKSTWFIIDGTDVSFDEEAIGEWVNSMGKKYNTFGKAKKFTSTSGEEVTVPAGSLGWKIAYQGEIDAIKADLEGGQNVTRDFTYLYKGASHGENDYGDSYVEVNLTEQHVYVYKDGEMVFDTDCVTGNVYSNHDTHTGAYPIAYKAKDATLRGADYTSFVNYWMPFNNGEGLHDATWRNRFGGTIYQGGGSHGCVNLPLSAAKSIYEIVDAGWPVLVFYTGDTEAEIDAVRFPYINAMNLISNLETITVDSAAAIQAAREAYDALTDDQKAMVTNYDTLVNAEQTIWYLQLGLEPPQ